MDLHEIRNLTIDDIKEIVRLYDTSEYIGESNILTPLVEANKGDVKFGDILDVIYDKKKIANVMEGIDRSMAGIIAEMLRWQICRNSRWALNARFQTRLKLLYHPFSYLYNNSLIRPTLEKRFEENKDEIYILAIQRLVAENYSRYLNYASMPEDDILKVAFTDKVPYPIPEDYTLKAMNEFCLIRIRSTSRMEEKYIQTILGTEACEDLPEDVKKKISVYSYVYSREIRSRYTELNIERALEKEYLDEE